MPPEPARTRLLITGVTGFLGRNVLDTLRGDDHFEVHGLVRSAPAVAGIGTEHAVTYHRADFTDLDSVLRVLDAVRPSHLLNLAWIGGELHADRYASTLNHAWARSTAEVFEAFAASGGQRLVSAGTCLEYGGSPPPWNEDATTSPDTAYGQGKLASSESALSLALSTAVGRIFFTYGPYEDRRRLVPDVVTSLLLGQEVALSSGTQRRDYLHMGDVSRALVGLLRHDGVGVYNIGAGSSWPVADLAGAIADQLGRPELLRFGARPDGGDTAEELTSCSHRIEHELGWRPQFDLFAGLADCIQWWRSELRRTGELS